MRPRLLELLRCPDCRGRVQATSFVASPDGAEVVEGVLTCSCGTSYPIVDTIPRMVPNAYDLFPEFVAQYDRHPALGGRVRASGSLSRDLARTQQSFGYQWTTFSEMVCDFRENFWNYLEPATPEFLSGRLGLDAGCGFGRHIYHAANCGAEIVGMDFSRAIDSSRQNTKHLPNVYLVQGDIHAPPFAPETFDFVYSVGVLHHLPDPLRGVRSLSALLRPNGTMFVWLYSKKRRVSNAVLETVRTVSTRLPHRWIKGVSFAGAVVDQFFIVAYRVLRRVPGVGLVLERVMFPRVKLYSRYPFQVLQADWFDRLAAPIRYYYDESGVEALLRSAGLTDRRISPTGLYGWRGCGVRQQLPERV